MINSSQLDKNTLGRLKHGLEQLLKVCVVLMSDRNQQNILSINRTTVMLFNALWEKTVGEFVLNDDCVLIRKQEFESLTLRDMHGSAAEFLEAEIEMLRKAVNKKDATWDKDQLRAAAIVISFLEDRVSQIREHPVSSERIAAIKTLQARFASHPGKKEYEVDV